MAVSYKRSWGDAIADVTDSPEFQTCVVKIVDPSLVEGGVYDVATAKYTPVTEDGVVYEGRARFIPIRFSVFQEAGAQGNTASLQAGRVQIPVGKRGLVIGTGFQVFFEDAPFNSVLKRRVATVTEDFQGSTTATRTFSVSLDSDVEVTDVVVAPDPDPDPDTGEDG